MKESYEKGSANRSASNPTPAMATSRVWYGPEVHAGQVFSSEITTLACPRGPDGGRQHATRRIMASRAATRRSLRPWACVDTPVARTGRSCWFPSGSDGMFIAGRNGQQTSPTVRLT